MVLVISLLLVAQPVNISAESRWDSPDILIEDSLGPNAVFAADYNYSTGDIYVACLPDSGTYFGTDYWGILLFRSTNHGLSWDLICDEMYSSASSKAKDIDLVVTREDTAYALVSWHDKNNARDEMSIIRIFDTGAAEWNSEWILSNITGNTIVSPKLSRDDFSDFYLYMAYMDTTAGTDTAYIMRSTDRGYNWGTLATGGTDEYKDVDMTVSDSSFYTLWTFQGIGNHYLQFAYFRNRGAAGVFVDNLFINDTLSYTEMTHPRIGATTTTPDNEQLVYAFFSQENADIGGYDLLYRYSEDGGENWSSDTDTLTQGSDGAIISDIRGYQAAPNEYMDITYSYKSSIYLDPIWILTYDNYFQWSSEGDPTNWHDTTNIDGGLFNSVPELIYSPGAPATGGAVIYNDNGGNLWFDAPWYSGVPENVTKEEKDKIRSQIVLSTGSIKINSESADIYDISGRKLKTIESSIWDLTDKNGKKVDVGIYFLVNSKTGEKVKLTVVK